MPRAAQRKSLIFFTSVFENLIKMDNLSIENRKCLILRGTVCPGSRQVVRSLLTIPPQFRLTVDKNERIRAVDMRS